MSEPAQNPWLEPGEYIDQQPEVARAPVVSTGPTQPHPGLQTQLSGNADSAAQHAPAPSPPGRGIWVVGVHGGAGESTIAELDPYLHEAHHRWPPAANGPATCILVARTNAAGLYNARAAAKDWGSGMEPHVVLLGLVLVPDAPGKLPKELVQEITRTSGGVPRVWQLPWVEDWRYHAPGYIQLDTTDLPRPVKKMLADLAELTLLDVSKENPSQ